MPRNRLRARNARRWVGRLEVVGMGATLLQTTQPAQKSPRFRGGRSWEEPPSSVGEGGTNWCLSGGARFDHCKKEGGHEGRLNPYSFLYH
jgi:hypothetical protein